MLKQIAVKSVTVLMTMFLLTTAAFGADVGGQTLKGPAGTPSKWAAPYIKEAKAAGLVPDNVREGWQEPISRQDFCALAVRLLESRGCAFTGWRSVNFVDTDNEAVQKACAAGVVKGTRSDRLGKWFSPDKSITRQEAAVMLFQMTNTDVIPAAQRLQLTPQVWKDREGGKGYNADGVEASYFYPWARDAVSFCYNGDIMAGVGENRFGPNESYTVEQSVVTMLKMKKWAEQNGGINRSAGRMVMERDLAKQTYGFTSLDGKTEIPKQYATEAFTDTFSQQVVYPSSPEKQFHWGFAVINTKGNVQPNLYGEDTGNGENAIDNQYLIDRTGKVIAQNNPWKGKFYTVSVLSDHTAFAQGDGKSALISLPEGKVLIDSIGLEQGWVFDDWKLYTYKDLKTNLMGAFDRTGKVIIPAKYKALGWEHQGVLCAFPSEKEGPILLDTAGKRRKEDCGIDWAAVREKTGGGSMWSENSFGRDVYVGDDMNGGVMSFDGKEIVPITMWDGVPLNVHYMKDGTVSANISGDGVFFGQNGKRLTPAPFDKNNYYELLYGRYDLCLEEQTEDGIAYAKHYVCDNRGRRISGQDFASAVGDGGNTMLLQMYIDPENVSETQMDPKNHWAILLDDQGVELSRIPDAQTAYFVDGMVCIEHSDGALQYYTSTGHLLK